VARQLITAGLAGGTLGAAQGDDLWSVIKSGAEGVAGGAAAKVYGGKLVGMIDQRTARRVGEMLASDDLDVLSKGLEVVANSRLRMDGLRNLDTRLAALLAARGGAAATSGLMEGHSGSGSNYDRDERMGHWAVCSERAPQRLISGGILIARPILPPCRSAPLRRQSRCRRGAEKMGRQSPRAPHRE
jgi:hypothetical protein